MPPFTKEQAIQNTSILHDQVMVLAAAVNSEESSLTQGRARQFIGIRLDTLRMLATSSQHSATPQRAVSEPAADARKDGANRIRDHPRLARAAGIPEVANQHTAAPLLMPQGGMCPCLRKESQSIDLLESSWE